MARLNLSRWRHGFEPRWDYEQRPRSDPLSSLNRESARPFVPHSSRGRTRHVADLPRIRPGRVDRCEPGRCSPMRILIGRCAGRSWQGTTFSTVYRPVHAVPTPGRPLVRTNSVEVLQGIAQLRLDVLRKLVLKPTARCVDSWVIALVPIPPTGQRVSRVLKAELRLPAETDHVVEVEGPASLAVASLGMIASSRGSRPARGTSS